MHTFLINPEPRKTYIRVLDYILSHLFILIAVGVIFIGLTQNITTLDGSYSRLILVMGLLMWVNGLKDSLFYQKREGKDTVGSEEILPLLFIGILLLSFIILYL